MTNQFTHTEINERFLEEVGRRGHGSIKYKVTGYWSSDALYVHIDRKYSSDDNKWTIEISRSSGGRDTGEVADDIEANRNFAAALLDAIEKAEYIKTKWDVIQKYYNLQMEEYEKERLQQQAEKEALLANDPGFDFSEAKNIIDATETRLRDALKSIEHKWLGRTSVLLIAERGKKNKHEIRAELFDKLRFYVDGQKTSKKDVIKYLVNKSKSSFEYETMIE